MRPIGIGVAVALILSALSPAGAWAAAKTAAGPITKDQRDKGMAAAPGLITAGGLDCQLADARQIGQSVDPKTKEKSTLYELACTGNEGLIVQQVGVTNAPAAFTCLEAAEPRADGKPNSTQCILPGNSDPKAGLAPYIAKSGVPCTLDKVRALGHSSTDTAFELACHEANGGYMLEISAPPRLDKPITMSPCIGFSESSAVKCTMTDRTAQLAIVDRLAAQSGKPCQIKDRAFIGASAETHKTYFEVACQDGKGYMLEQSANGVLSRTIDCVNADAIGGGCKLTDTRQAKTEQTGLYTQLAKKAGFNCDVSGYAPFSVNLGGKEVVELACSNRPDGAVGIFGARPGDPAEVLDCAHSELKGFRCGLTKPAAAYPNLTAQLKQLGKSSCTVSSSRVVGMTADQHAYVEVGCADGLQGFFIEYTMNPLTPKNAIVCAAAKGIAGGCTLPGNTKS